MWAKALRVLKCKRVFDSSLLESAFRFVQFEIFIMLIFCSRWNLQYRIHLNARRFQLRPFFREWKHITRENSPIRLLRARAQNSLAKSIQNFSFYLWRKKFLWKNFVTKMVREYEAARTRGLARVALRRWRRWSIKHAIKSEEYRFGMKL